MTVVSIKCRYFKRFPDSVPAMGSQMFVCQGLFRNFFSGDGRGCMAVRGHSFQQDPLMDGVQLMVTAVHSLMG